MRGPLLIGVLLFAVTLSGCLAEVADDTPPTDLDSGESQGVNQDLSATDGGLEPGTTVSEGDSLGQLVFEESGEMSVQGVDTACDAPDVSARIGGLGNNRADHPWGMGRVSPDGVPWRIETLTVTLTPDPRTTTDMDVFIYDNNGNLIGRTEEVGPDGADGISSVTLSNVAAGPLELTVVNCGGASTGYTVKGTADMVASQDFQVSSESKLNGASNAGGVRVERRTNGDGDVYYVATREESFSATLTGGTGTASISTGAGFIEYTGRAGNDHELLARLTARGDTEQQARNRLSEMSVDHIATDGAAVVLEAHGNPGPGGWNNKQIDLEFQTPFAIDWTKFNAETSAGGIDATHIKGTDLGLQTSAGAIDANELDGDVLRLQTSAGSIDMDDMVAGELVVIASAGSIDGSSISARDMNLQSGAGHIDVDTKTPTAGGTWKLQGSAGSIDLTVVEATNVGYSVDARTSAGSVDFDFKDFTETTSDCEYASCHRAGKTNGYETRTHKVTVDLDTSAGSIDAGS